MSPVSPPGLPEPIADIRDESDGIPTFDTVWDTLARTALTMHYQTSNERQRVIWLRYSFWHWCCHRPMRIARVDRQPRHVTFGWEPEIFKFAGCRLCGRIKGWL